jgi:hypothetical protein
MLYRLTFGITGDGYLRVTAFGKGRSEISSTIDLNERIFADIVKTAKLTPFQSMRLLEAAREARNQSGIDICCEAVELNETQVERLCLRPGRDCEIGIG